MRRRTEIESSFSPTESLAPCRAFFLVGIGGAGMSALARMLSHRGYAVAGTDAVASQETARLIEEGHDVSIGHSGLPVFAFAQRDEKVALVVTDAVDIEHSPEVAEARKLGLPVVRRSQALGWLLRPYKVIAVTGTHGKTTTTGMLGAGLIAAGVDPLVVVGAPVIDWNGPVREGNGVYAIVEACEAYEAYNDIDPYIVVLTNLEPDHLDYHGSYESLRDSMVKFVSKIPPSGGLVYCADDRGAAEVAELTDVRCMPYGLSDTWLQQISNKFEMGIDAKNTDAGKALSLNLPGDHNRMNATGALAAASLLNNDETIADLGMVEMGIARFNGAERRLQVLLDGPITVVDDYAHHPSEITASIKALKQKFPGRRIVVAFQPHLYSRTLEHLKDFPKSLDEADFVFITDIYPAREAPIPGVSSVRIAERLTKPMRYVPSRYLLPRVVRAMIKTGDVVCGMGAGNIHEFAPDLIREIERDIRPKKSVAVIYGGDSSEREVSILSGNCIAKALEKAGFEVETYDVTNLLLRKGALLEFTGSIRPDVAFLAVHGTHAEDGAIQGLFELLHIPYTGSNILSSALAMDKDRTKQILSAAGVRVPQGQLVFSADEPVTISAPAVVKPNKEGSTVGLSFAHTEEELRKGVVKALQYPGGVLIEEWVQGTEISVPVLCGEALPVVEISPKDGGYDFANKYTVGATEEIIPARLSDAVLKEAQRIALLGHHTLGCTGATRTDIIVRDDELFVLEVNTLPGMTTTSLLPNSAQAAGISFEALCTKIVEDALARDGQKV
ncbi:MAG: UDP-N-acetylmuramate--L-alanine ligase [Armatimonadetes bacterium]|nr:UDP-N-acetylmuramate--L-alanine ligase [Armatimonadota bacterium]